jgi:formamidopyrimidine-DNA glycosylase
MCHIPDKMDLSYLQKHLQSRRETIRKLLRDRRIVVEMGDRMSVYSCETLELGKKK